MKFNLLLLFSLVAISSAIVANTVKNATQAVISTLTSNNSSDYCFANQNGFDGPINKLLVIAPMSPNKMKVTFLLFTCKNKDQPQNFTYLSDPSDWKNSNFNTSVITRFIVHGFIEKYPGNIVGYNWMEQMKNLILSKSCVNVIAVDWSEPARSIYYYQSAYNTRVVGQMIGCVINRFKTDLNYSPENVHLIGHSLGGELVGFAGKHVQNPKVRRITGLDPAGPGFNDYGDQYKLAYTDGKCVIAIHTDGDNLGHFNPQGNIDFYPNGGKSQPGCSANEVALKTVKSIFTSPNKTIENFGDFILCDHVRSNKYAIADENFVNTTCQLIGYNCSSYDDFNLGKCADCGSTGNGCKPMPLNLDYWDDPNNCDSNAKHIQYFLNTSDVETGNNYCLHHYQIIVTVNGTSNTCAGDVTIKLSNGKLIGVTLGTQNSIDPQNGNQRFTKLYTDSESLATIDIAAFSKTTNCALINIEMNYMSNIDPGVRKSMSKSFAK